jgi:hypothetical protein
MLLSKREHFQLSRYLVKLTIHSLRIAQIGYESSIILFIEIGYVSCATHLVDLFQIWSIRIEVRTSLLLKVVENLV